MRPRTGRPARFWTFVARRPPSVDGRRKTFTKPLIVEHQFPLLSMEVGGRFARVMTRETPFAAECATFEHKLARVGWLIDDLTRGRKRAVAAELKLSRSTLARYTCASAADWSDTKGPVKLPTLERILRHLGLKLEVVLAAAEEARTPEELRYFARGALQLLPPGHGSTHLVRLVG